MKKTLTALLLLAATPAFAHPGHELFDPDHLLMAAAVAALLVAGVRQLWRSKKTRHHE